MQPKVALCCAQEKRSCVSTTLYFESARDVFGRHLQSTAMCFAAVFFMIENFHTRSATVHYRSVDNDLYGAWTMDHPPTRHCCRCPIPDLIGHALERIQSQFIDERLFFHKDRAAQTYLAAYRQHGIAIHAVNMRFKKPTRLGPVRDKFIHCTPGSDLHLMEFIEKH
ncbi:MAG: hypothetical protein H7315_03810 [Herminiimonas sp.]|nr:hypothetical protein [Herminiimonas sp.]